jgi:hypothetical protein
MVFWYSGILVFWYGLLLCTLGAAILIAVVVCMFSTWANEFAPPDIRVTLEAAILIAVAIVHLVHG